MMKAIPNSPKAHSKHSAPAHAPAAPAPDPVPAPATSPAAPVVDPLAAVREVAQAHALKIRALLNQPHVSEAEMNLLLRQTAEWLETV